MIPNPPPSALEEQILEALAGRGLVPTRRIATGLAWLPGGDGPLHAALALRVEGHWLLVGVPESPAGGVTGSAALALQCIRVRAPADAAADAFADAIEFLQGVAFTRLGVTHAVAAGRCVAVNKERIPWLDGPFEGALFVEDPVLPAPDERFAFQLLVPLHHDELFPHEPWAAERCIELLRTADPLCAYDRARPPLAAAAGGTAGASAIDTEKATLRYVVDPAGVRLSVLVVTPPPSAPEAAPRTPALDHAPPESGAPAPRARPDEHIHADVVRRHARTSAWLALTAVVAVAGAILYAVTHDPPAERRDAHRVPHASDPQREWRRSLSEALRGDGRNAARERSAGRRRAAQAKAQPHLTPWEHGAPVVAIAVSADGTRIASADDTGIVRERDARNGIEDALRRGPPERVRELTYAPRGALLAVLGEPGGLQLLAPSDALTGRALLDDALGAGWSGDGLLLACASDGRALCLDAQGRLRPVAELPVPQESQAWTPAASGTAAAWIEQQGRRVHVVHFRTAGAAWVREIRPAEPATEGDDARGAALAFADGDRVVIVGSAAGLTAFRTDSGAVAWRRDDLGGRLCVSGDRTRIAVFDADVAVLDAADGRTVATTAAGGTPLEAAALTFTGDAVVVARGGGHVSVHRVREEPR